MSQEPSPATGERSRVLMALDAMIESVQEDMRETDVGNHATLCALNGELKGLKAARTYIELDGLRPSNAIQMALPKPSAASETPRNTESDTYLGALITEFGNTSFDVGAHPGHEEDEDYHERVRAQIESKRKLLAEIARVRTSVPSASRLRGE